MRLIEEIFAWGHEHISSTHKTTIEITKDNKMTKKGDCIIGTNASKSCYDLNPDLKKLIKNEKKLKITLKVGDTQDIFHGFGNKKLQLSDRKDIVFRKSDFICNRTVLIKCSKSSIELSRKLIKLLKHPKNKLSIRFELDD